MPNGKGQYVLRRGSALTLQRVSTYFLQSRYRILDNQETGILIIVISWLETPNRAYYDPILPQIGEISIGYEYHHE